MFTMFGQNRSAAKRFNGNVFLKMIQMKLFHVRSLGDPIKAFGPLNGPCIEGSLLAANLIEKRY